MVCRPTPSPKMANEAIFSEYNLVHIETVNDSHHGWVPHPLAVETKLFALKELPPLRAL